MKELVTCLVVTAALLGSFKVVPVGAQAATNTPSALNISVVFNSAKYLLNDQNDPISAEITIKNVGSQPIITSSGFSQQAFHLFFTFIDPDGKPITATGLGQSPSAGLPRVIFANNVAVQVEPVEVLAAGSFFVVLIPDVRAFYALNKAGRYSGKVTVPVATYPAVDFTVAGANFASIGSFNFAGAIESNTLRFSLIADADKDGYAFPEPDSRVSQFPVADCDDHDAAVNPGMIEIFGDGKDNDCNPATLDEVVAVPIDIKPGNFPNSISLTSKGTVPVAILSTATFDATKVDPLTVTLEDAKVALKGKGTPQSSFEDVNKDGRLDLVVHVSTQAMTLSVGDTQAVLTGRTFAVPGRPVFQIRGVDSVRVVP